LVETESLTDRFTGNGGQQLETEAIGSTAAATLALLVSV
jgi:hypothetical protein